MYELFASVKDTPVPTILVVAGIVFIFFSLGGRLSAGEIPAGREKVVGSIGAVLLILGTGLFLLPGFPDRSGPVAQVIEGPATPERTITATIEPTREPTSTPTLEPSPSPTSTEPPPSPTSTVPTTETPELVMGTPSPEELLAEARKWREVAFDRFNQNEYEWFVGTEKSDKDRTATTTIDGKYRVHVDVATGGERHGWWPFYSNIATPADFLLEVEMRRIEPVESTYGIVFRGGGSDNRRDSYYWFRIWNDRQFTVSRYHQNEVSTLIEWTSSRAIVPNAANRLTVLAKGGIINFYINDEVVGEVQEVRNLTRGYVGFLVYLYEDAQVIYEFDNLELRVP